MATSSNGSTRATPVASSNGHAQPDSALTPIAERSHENSSVASLRSNSFNGPSRAPNDDPVAVPTTSWWFWASTAAVMQNGAAPMTESENAAPMTVPPSTWWVTTRRIATFGMYSDDTVTETNETELLLPKNGNKSQETSSWFSWLWGNAATPEEDSDDEYTDDIALFRSAKLAIESSKESCSYAYRHSLHSQFLINESELTVAGTPTEYNPVKYNSRKVPLMPIESQESMLAPAAANATVTATSTPTVASSSSSMKSVTGVDDIPGVLVPNVSAVIPDLDENYRNITFLTRLRLLGQHILFQHNSSECHLYKQSSGRIATRRLDKVKKVVIIGVHGFLPTKFVKGNIGRSTGNANDIIQEATRAVEQWLNDEDEALLHTNKLHSNMYTIDTIALEGQGTISDRVGSSLDLISNWADIINDCDFLFVAGHSQGALIAIHLLARMLMTSSFHLYSKKIGLLSMAAPILGPSRALDAKIIVRAYTPGENEVLREFLQFSNQQSTQSIELLEALQVLVRNNVKVTLGGSCNDAIIPIDSALAVSLYHPNLFRCLYIDKDAAIPAFISWMWKLILITRNVGHVEHGASQFLASRCMGALAEGGHCRIMAETGIYKTSIKQALETTDLNQRRDIRVCETEDTDNLFKLPWSVRELIEDVLQTKHITSLALVNSLLHEYRHWEPTTKIWKEIKQTLQALTLGDPDDLIV